MTGHEPGPFWDDGQNHLQYDGPIADGDVLTFDAATQRWLPKPGQGGASGQGSPVVRKFPFAYNTPGILTGAALYTPTNGDVVLDVGVRLTTLWDGTTPTLDVGTFVGSTSGLFDNVLTTALPVDSDGSFSGGTGLDFGIFSLASLYTLAGVTSLWRVPAIPSTPQGAVDLQFFQSSPWGFVSMGLFSAANPVKVCVSQDGTNTGADPGSTQGAGILYLVTATPV